MKAAVLRASLVVFALSSLQGCALSFKSLNTWSDLLDASTFEDADSLSRA